MAGMPAPKSPENRVRRAAPARGDWQVAVGVGWQHGEVPAAPTGLTDTTVEAWQTWMGAWFASFWTPEDLPGLRRLVILYDRVERNPDSAALVSQLRQYLDMYGITPKGQQDRRWAPPVEQSATPRASGSSKRLQVVG